MPVEELEFHIHCPYHGVTETLKLPENYKRYDFQGEVTCSRSSVGGVRPPLRIKIVGGEITHVERAK